jgi:hypothetical protein
MLLPVGAVEQHGPHLPLDTDAFDADYLARRVAEACSDPKPLVLPAISYGVSYHHADFTGTISIANETLARLVYEIGISVSRNGIQKLVIINGHGGNSPALNYAAQKINRDAHIFVCVDSGETSGIFINSLKHPMMCTPAKLRPVQDWRCVLNWSRWIRPKNTFQSSPADISTLHPNGVFCGMLTRAKYHPAVLWVIRLKPLLIKGKKFGKS